MSPQDFQVHLVVKRFWEGARQAIGRYTKLLQVTGPFKDIRNGTSQLVEINSYLFDMTSKVLDGSGYGAAYLVPS